MSNSNFGSFETMDLGSAKPTSVAMEVIDVVIDPADILDNYAKAFVSEAQRKNPLRFEQVGLSVDEMQTYVRFLLVQRVKSVRGECPEFRQLKCLYVPSYIQYVMSLIGRVLIRDMGLTIMPTVDEDTITLKEAIQISEKVGSFEDDLQIVQDAMPRSEAGNPDLMGTALIAGYVRAIKPVSHVAFTYVTAFLNMKLRQEAAMATLYRVQYDDIGFIEAALTTQKSLY